MKKKKLKLRHTTFLPTSEKGDLSRPVSTGLVPVKTKVTGGKVLKKKKKKKKRRTPMSEQYYYTLLVGVIGYRQNLFCTLEEFERRLARGEDCRHLLGMYKERFLQQCQMEYFVAGLAHSLYPDFKPPHGMLNYPELTAKMPDSVDRPTVRIDGKEV
jgi:hypothetical protein